MTTASIDDDYEEFDDLEDDEDEDRGLSGLMVLLMGLVMFGAIASVVFYAYRHGVKTGESYATTRTITADPEPIKVENLALNDTPDNDGREVYDRIDGAPSSPVEIIAEGPEEPIDRSDDAEDIFSSTNPFDNVVVEAPSAADSDDAVADRIAQLAAADAALSEEPSSAPSTPVQKPEPTPVTTPQVVSASTTPTSASGGPLSGSHLVQVGAFRSDGEVAAFRARMESKLGAYLDGKTPDIERADLGDKGVFYRLRLGPFASRSDAADYCMGLKDRGQDCIVKAK